MSRTYKIDVATGTTTELARIRSLDEGKELQILLERNFDLLPGDQIDPDQKRKWLLIKREMPVPDPAQAMIVGQLTSFLLTNMEYRPSWNARGSMTPEPDARSLGR